MLDGRDGRDVLIGRGGADQLIGGNQDDLLIAGTTTFDTNLAALNSILLEWSSSRPYATRVINLRGGIGGLPSLLKTTNVQRDLGSNQITGGLGKIGSLQTLFKERTRSPIAKEVSLRTSYRRTFVSIVQYRYRGRP